jgi:SAM-dependent methyltransferase
VPDFASKLRRLSYSLASRGLSRTVLDVAGLLIKAVGNKTGYHAEHDRAFDRRFGTDTAGKVESRELGYADKERQEQAIRYLPSPAGVTRWMLDNIGIDHSQYSFVDLGCGKGRVVLAAAQYPFQSVLGVDLSMALTEVASRNVSIFPASSRKCGDVRILTVDATKVDYPDTNLLLHLYHPFDANLTAAVLRNLEALLAAKPRQVRIAYLLYTAAVPATREAFTRFPWLRETQFVPSLLGHYDWLFYSN